MRPAPPFAGGDKRTRRAGLNILASFLIKGWDMAVYFLLVPLTLGYLNETEYGIWLTLNSILMWINTFDIGLGNGLRNRLAEALAKDDRQLCKVYVSTAFFMLCGVMLVLLAVGYAATSAINWHGLLNVTHEAVPQLEEMILVAYALFCCNFVLKFIGNVYQSLQLPAVSNLLVCLGHTLSLAIIFVLTLVTDGSRAGADGNPLFYVVLAYSAAPPLVYLTAYPFTFGGRYRFMAPSFKAFRWQCVRSLLSMGVLFFVIQLGGLLLFSTTNLVIANLFGPENVASYNITQRYFSIVMVGMSLITAPMWSATTDAYVRGDIEWIKATMRRINRIMLVAVAAIAVMLGASGLVYGVWLGGTIEIPFKMSALMGVYTTILIWSLAYSNFLNGMGKLRIQAWNTIIVGVLFIPLSILCGKTWGIYGVVAALIAANLSGATLNTIQFNKIIHKGVTHGFWSK